MKYSKKKILLIIGLSVVLIGIVWLTLPRGDESESGDVARCEKGLFETTVSTVGQLEATKTIDITSPDALKDRRKVRIFALKIVDLVAEGTKVKKGDFVASLDPNEVDERLKEVKERLDQLQNNYESACLDSSLRLSGYRDAILSAKDQLTDKEIKVEQSKYESKAYQRQAQIEYEKAKREVERKKRDLTSQRIRLGVKIQHIENDIKFEESRQDKLNELKVGLKILAPANGMVIYGENRWQGRKFKIGDEVNRWNTNIAVLPDLNSLVSEAFVQEVDIKNVKIGQLVRIGVDAFPDKIFTGRIVKIANIGQKIPGKKVNGFKVSVKLDEYNEELFPGMTTNNSIVTGSWDEALFIPRPALFSSDSLNYVYVSKGLSVVKKQVITGGENETQFRILCGLEAGDKILMYEPANAVDMEIEMCDN